MWADKYPNPRVRDVEGRRRSRTGPIRQLAEKDGTLEQPDPLVRQPAEERGTP